LLFKGRLITTNAATPVDGTFCPVSQGGTGIANLAVTGPGKYKWWNHPTSISPSNIVAVGGTYTTPILTSPTTYYVEDTSTFALNPNSAIILGSLFLVS